MVTMYSIGDYPITAYYAIGEPSNPWNPPPATTITYTPDAEVAELRGILERIEEKLDAERDDLQEVMTVALAALRLCTRILAAETDGD
ncbi:MAG: hypothetical protein GY835_23945 [bacterium]|nr:hypothetical protein [bacterium]